LKHVWNGKLLRLAEQKNVAMHFPSAIQRPYKLAGGQRMSVWYDRYGLEPTAPEHTESVEESCEQLRALIDDIIASGIPPSRIAIGGFSMGGGIALQCVLRGEHRLAACFALSSFMCDEAVVYERLASEKKPLPTSPPIFMRHGDSDDFILPQWGASTAKKLQSFELSVDFGLVPRARHELVSDEIEELADWLFPKLLTADRDGTDGHAAPVRKDET